VYFRKAVHCTSQNSLPFCFCKFVWLWTVQYATSKNSLINALVTIICLTGDKIIMPGVEARLVVVGTALTT